MGSNHMHDLFRNSEMNKKKNIPTHDPQTGELNPHYEELTGEKNPLDWKAPHPDKGWIDWNTLSMDELVEYLENKYMFSSSGDAYAINKLIEFYKENQK
jgi:hypothetical protein